MSYVEPSSSFPNGIEILKQENYRQTVINPEEDEEDKGAKKKVTTPH